MATRSSSACVALNNMRFISTPLRLQLGAVVVLKRNCRKLKSQVSEMQVARTASGRAVTVQRAFKKRYAVHGPAPAGRGSQSSTWEADRMEHFSGGLVC